MSAAVWAWRKEEEKTRRNETNKGKRILFIAAAGTGKVTTMGGM
jgi:hydrogenase maturation factor HypE